jgi:hypothetical protein
MAPLSSLFLSYLENNKVHAGLFSALALSTLALLYLQPYQARDPREPPFLAANIPYIGHLLGLIFHQAEYFQRLA